jgi:monoamine oxidase
MSAAPSCPDHAVENGYPHIPISTILEEIRTQNTGPRHVVILGAGMAGLVAAYELLKLGNTVEIIEASGAAGGRVHTHHFKDGSYAELGAMRVPITHDYTHYYIAAMGLRNKLITFINNVENGFWDIRNVVTRQTAAGAASIYQHYRLSEAFRKVQNFPSGGAIFGFLMDNFIEGLTEDEKQMMFEGVAGTRLLQLLSGTSLGEFLIQSAGEEVQDVIGVFTSLDVWWDKALSMYLRDEMVGTGSCLQTLEGGMSQLPDALYAEVSAHVTFNREVVRIKLLDHKVQVTTKTPDQEGTEKTQEYDYVLCTIPFSVLRRIDLENLSYAKMSAIRGMTYASSTKVALDCKERFWQNGPHPILGGSSTSDHIQRQTYYPMDHLPVTKPLLRESVRPTVEGARFRRPSIHTTTPQAAPPEALMKNAESAESMPGALLGAYCWDQDARRLGALSNDERAEVVIENVSRFHPELREYVVDHASIAWDQYRWTAGAFVMLKPNELERLYPAAIRPEGRLYFAGEHCSTDQGWIQGALIASLRAVLQIVSTK